GEMLIPPYANRALASHDKGASRSGFLLAGVFSAFWFLAIVLLGIFASAILGDTPSDNVLLELANTVLPAGLKGIFIVALAAIVMSTQESVLNAGAAIFTNDIWCKTNRARTESILLVGRVATLIIAVAAIFLAYFMPSIISILLISYAIWAPAVAIPLAWYLLGLPVRANSGTAAMVFGCVTSLITVLV